MHQSLKGTIGIVLIIFPAIILGSAIPWNPKINDYVLNPLDRRSGDAFTGNMIETVGEWEEYRQELIDFASENAFGNAPDPGTYTQENTITSTKQVKNNVTLKTVRITISGPNGSHSWNVKVWLPQSDDPLKVLIFNDHRGNSWGDEASSGDFNLDLILSRGYGAAYYPVNSVGPGGGDGDARDSYKEVLHNKFNLNGNKDWGLIATWAFGGLRVSDALHNRELFPEIGEAGVSGHSRSGHTAEWMAGQDTRLKICISNGATDLFAFTGKPEQDKQDLGWKAFWYSSYFAQYYKNEWPVVPWPEDGNIGIALVAPRLFALGTGESDNLVGGRYLPSEYYAAVFSQPVWDLYGLLEDDPWTSDEYDPSGPVVRRNGNLHYHMATHGHGLETWDWNQYLDFMDERWNSSEVVSTNRQLVSPPSVSPDRPVYDLQGRLVRDLQRDLSTRGAGIYIIKGKSNIQPRIIFPGK